MKSPAHVSGRAGARRLRLKGVVVACILPCPERTIKLANDGRDNPRASALHGTQKISCTRCDTPKMEEFLERLTIGPQDRQFRSSSSSVISKPSGALPSAGTR